MVSTPGPFALRLPFCPAQEPHMKITVDIRKPRNPFVTLSRTRRAGTHRADPKAERQRSGQAIRRELSHAEADRRSP